ncbi:E3 ubiquitin-protein ligase UPL5 [Rosa sericea]
MSGNIPVGDWAAHQRGSGSDSAGVAVAAAARLSSKRKLDEYGGLSTFSDDEDDAVVSDLVHVRMRKDEPNAVDSSSNNNGAAATQPQSSHLNYNSRVSTAARSASSRAESARHELTRSWPMLQFFIKTISGGNTLVIQAHAHDSVKTLHERIEAITRIPATEQRLIYRGKQLQWEQSLAQCSIQNDASLQLVGRLRSTHHPQAWQVLEDLVSVSFRLCRSEKVHEPLKYIKSRLSQYLAMAQKEKTEDSGASHMQVFIPSSAPLSLFMLYNSPVAGNKDIAEESIKYFLNSYATLLPKNLHNHCAPIVLEFCKFLRRVGQEDPLYILCRSALGSFWENAGGLQDSECVDQLVRLKEIYPFLTEVANSLSKDLELSMESPASLRPLLDDVRDFKAFLLPMRTAIAKEVYYTGPICASSKAQAAKYPVFGEEIELLRSILADLLKRMAECLTKVVECLAGKGKGDSDIVHSGWSQYLAVLKELHGICKLYQGGEEQFWTTLRLRKTAICALVVKYAKRSDDHQWLLEHKDVLDFESRRHLAMMMFPDVKEDYEELHEMLIDRSQLLSESFAYIGSAEPESLHAGLFMEFKNEEATGPGVLREWFFLVCQDIFNPQNALFVACPNDRRRFYPNPASKVDPMHLDYFTFAGRVIALALMHKVQVGIVFDRIFFQQLAGTLPSLEDIRDADPYLYNSCKQILEMDPDFIDSDALGLTFVREVEELGSRKTVELRAGGRNIVVTSKNREEYVKLLIKHRFVISITEQVKHFAKGFGDILSNSVLQTFFFRSLELEDLDWMLHGSESAISVEDWKAHTEYNGYKETDPQICWFWKIVGEMSAEQRKVLLFFWTSVKYLPVEGFRGLASRLYIYKSSEPPSRLPSSHTCFYRLCFPPYPSMAVMRGRLNIITQEHVGSSFGTW